MAKTLVELPQRSFPSNTEINLREPIIEVTLRSGKELALP